MNQRKTSRESCLGLCNENRRLKLLVDRQIKSICCNCESQHKNKNAKRTPQNTRYALIRGGCISSPHSVGLYPRVNTLISYPTNVDQPPGHSQASISCRQRGGLHNATTTKICTVSCSGSCVLLGAAEK